MANKNVYGEKIITPVGRASYPHVFERAKPTEAGKEGKYEIALYLPKETTNIQIFRDAAEKVAREAFGDKFKGLEKLRNNPIKDGDEMDDINAKGCWVIRAKSSRMPGVIGPDKLALKDKNEIYGGCWVRLSITPGSYDMPTGWGVTWFLNNVQKKKDDERFGGSGVAAEDEFDAFEEAVAEPEL